MPLLYNLSMIVILSSHNMNNYSTEMNSNIANYLSLEASGQGRKALDLVAMWRTDFVQEGQVGDLPEVQEKADASVGRVRSGKVSGFGII